MTNPFKDAVELLPELEAKMRLKGGNPGYIRTVTGTTLKSIITALEACRGLADGSEVVVPREPTEPRPKSEGLQFCDRCLQWYGEGAKRACCQSSRALASPTEKEKI
jgi:hypothetical protein